MAAGIRPGDVLVAIDGASGVPVENTGGAGTRGGHWRESIFQTELMTGWAGGAMAMSSVSVVTTALLLTRWAGGPDELALSMAPKTTTTPVAIALSEPKMNRPKRE